MANYKTYSIETTQGVLITLNRPTVLNALNDNCWMSLTPPWPKRADSEIRGIV
jgi:enoyl-CoA hydratase/carnithine racemase